MTKTKFEAKFLNQFIVELFGNQDVRDPLLLKDISQKVKYHLKKLGNAMQAEHKALIAQLQELYDKYSEEVPVDSTAEDRDPNAPLPSKRRIKEEFKEKFIKETSELEDLEIELEHYSFTEKDFIDHSTGDVVGGTTYFNLIDKLVYEKEEKAKLETV